MARDYLFPVLEFEIMRRGLDKKQIARAIGRSQRAFMNKLNGVTDFTWNEACIIQRNFFPEISKDKLFGRASS